MNCRISGKTNLHYKKNSYGKTLHENKLKLKHSFNQLSLPDEKRILFLAMAMIETTHLTSDQRDRSKDNTSSENISLWILSVDMVKCLGYQDNPQKLNSSDEIKTVINLLDKAVKIWNVDALLNFVRGGRRGFSDGVSYGCRDYRNTVATICNLICRDRGLMEDSLRIEIDLYHV